MTHCNAGALATCGWGTATAPLFLAHAEGMPLHVWVSETRPRLQGANLTAWEIAQHGIPHTLFVDGASGLLMRRGDVDLVHRRRRPRSAQRRRLQQDRHVRQGARRARQRRSVLCRAAVAHDRLDASRPATRYRSSRARRRGADVSSAATIRPHSRVAIAPAGTRAVNYAFDVTPARLVTASSPSAAWRDSAEALRSFIVEATWRLTARTCANRSSRLRWHERAGINRGTSGNVSARGRGGFLVTPSGLPYAETATTTSRNGHWMARSPDEQAVERMAVSSRHLCNATRSRRDRACTLAFATTLACLGRGIPAFHYMIAVAAAPTYVARPTRLSARRNSRIMR